MPNIKQGYLALFLIPLLFNPLSFHLYDIPKIGWFILVIGIALFTLGVLSFGQKKISIFYNWPLVFYSLFFFVLLILSHFSHPSFIQNFWGNYTKFNGALFFILLIFHFWFSIQILDKKNTLLFLKLTKWVGAILSIYALLQFFNWDPFIKVDNQIYLFRVYSSIGQPNLLAQFLIFPLFISAYDWLRRKKWFDLGLWLIILLTIFLTKNRATWLALITTGYGIFLLSHHFKPKVKYCMSGFLAILMTAFILFGNFSFRSLWSRWIIWKSSVKLIDFKTFLIGNGLDSFSDQILSVLPPSIFEYEKFYTLPASPHNESLQFLLDFGFLGLVMYGLPIGFLIYQIYRKRIKSGLQLTLAGSIFCYFISVQFSYSSIEHWVFLIAIWSILLKEWIPFKTLSFSSKKILNLANMVTGLLLVIFSLSLFTADLWLKKGFRAFLENYEKSQQYFEKAVAITPFYQAPKVITLSLFEDKKLAEKYVDSLGKINPHSFEFFIENLRLAQLKKDIFWVDENYKKLQQMSPFIPLVYTEAGNAFYKMRNCKKAINAYRRLEALAPSAYSLKNSQVVQEQESYRLFIKHATAFEEAMNQLEICRRKRSINLSYEPQ